MLVSSQTAVKNVHGFEIAVRKEKLARWGLGQDTKYSPPCSKYALEMKLVFSCFYVFDITNTEIHTWIEYSKYHGMRLDKI